MANLKKSAIELVTGVDGDKIETEVYYTSPFIPFAVVYEAIDLMEELEKNPEKLSEKELIDKMVSLVSERIYNNQFTKEDLKNGLHGPDAMRKLQENILFVARGEVSSDAKKLLTKKR